MLYSAFNPDPFFTSFDADIKCISLPEKFTYPFNYKPHSLSLLASEQLQAYLRNQQEWEHNFGLQPGQEGKVIGKMFGVLVVKNTWNEVGYLAAFSGKLAGGYHHAKLVPPVFDGLKEGGFLNVGMQELTRINKKIKSLEDEKKEINYHEIELLQALRKNNSVALQAKLFDHYHFLNQAGEEKCLRQIFQKNTNKNPPAGAGECAAPKLLHYAFQHKMKPLAMAEFWWGLSPKSENWKHGHYYPACKEKCEPILTHMLKDIAMDEQP